MRQVGLLKVPQHSWDIVTRQIHLGTIPIQSLANGREADGTDLLGMLVQGYLIVHLLEKDVVPISKDGFLVLIQHLLDKLLMLKSVFSLGVIHVDILGQQKLPTADPILCTVFQMYQVPAPPDIVQLQDLQVFYPKYSFVLTFFFKTKLTKILNDILIKKHIFFYSQTNILKFVCEF